MTTKTTTTVTNESSRRQVPSSSKHIYNHHNYRKRWWYYWMYPNTARRNISSSSNNSNIISSTNIHSLLQQLPIIADNDTSSSSLSSNRICTMKVSITATQTTLMIFIYTCTIFFIMTCIHFIIHIHMIDTTTTTTTTMSEPSSLSSSSSILNSEFFRTSSSLITTASQQQQQQHRQHIQKQNSESLYQNNLIPYNDFLSDSRSRQLVSMFHSSSLSSPLLKVESTYEFQHHHHQQQQQQQQHMLLSPPPIFITPSPSQQQQPLLPRICTSPEKNVPWIFGSTKTTTCNSNSIRTNTSTIRAMPTMVQSRTSDRMCGYCFDDDDDDDDQLLSNDESSHTTGSKKKKKKKKSEYQFVQYLYNLSTKLRILKEKECSSLIVYGVAFGEQYTHWLTRQQADIPVMNVTTTTTDDNNNRVLVEDDVPFKMSQEEVEKLLQLHGPCFMTFVLAEHMNDDITTAIYDEKTKQKYYYSNDGLQLLIPIQRDDLPYDNMRRNTKIFKMIGPSYIFGNWVQRVIWQDAKLVAYNVPNTILPHNYFEYFFNVIHMTSIPRNTKSDDHVCASFMGLPYHKNTMGSNTIQQQQRQQQQTAASNKKQQLPVTKRTVQFRPHCDAIIEASSKRPTISDDLHSVQYQCSIYYNETTIQQQQQQQQQEQLKGFDDTTTTSPPPHNALDDAMIDSAFIVWDLRSERCQNFVATISCTWLDEIHCYSDRDQVSFPYIFSKMGLQMIPTDVRMNYHNVIQNNVLNSLDPSQQQEQLQNIVTPETHHRLFAHYSTPLQPLVHFTKSSCHWYYNNLNDCDFTQNDPIPIVPPPKKRYYLPKILRPPRFLRKFIGYVPPNQADPTPAPIGKLSTSPKVYKLAIIVTGSFHRFIFQSSMQRLIQPLTNQGHYVDYYLSLSMEKAPAYRADKNYMNLLVNDPIFDKYLYNNEDGTILLDKALIKARIHLIVQQQLEVAGANLRYITFQDNYADMTSNPQVIARRERARQMYPNEDPDLRFPTLDIRDVSTMNRTANANRNMLNLFYHIQYTYQQVLAYEKEIRLKYDYVLFLRDDTMWLQSFDFRSLIDGPPNTTITNANEPFYVRTFLGKKDETNKSSTSTAELFVPSCDARVPSMHPAEINDHIAVVKRERADVYGFYFDELFLADLEKCAERLDDKLRYGHSLPRVKGVSSEVELSIPLRGCNSEMILQYILEQKNITIQKVGQGLIPFQRMALVKNPVTSNVHTCYHKYCQSYMDPLINHPGMKKCTDMQF